MDLGEVGVRERLLHRDAPRRVELQHRLHQVDRLRARVREHCPERAPLRGRQESHSASAACTPAGPLRGASSTALTVRVQGLAVDRLRARVREHRLEQAPLRGRRKLHSASAACVGVTKPPLGLKLWTSGLIVRGDQSR